MDKTQHIFQICILLFIYYVVSGKKKAKITHCKGPATKNEGAGNEKLCTPKGPPVGGQQ